MTDDDVQEVKELFMKVDVVKSCKTLADKYFQEAKTSLDNLKPVINQSELEFFQMYIVPLSKLAAK